MNLLMNGNPGHESRERPPSRAADTIAGARARSDTCCRRGLRYRIRVAKFGPVVQRLLHDKAKRHGHRPIDLPVDCREARRQHMGDSEFRGRQHVSIYVEHPWGDAIVATWVTAETATAPMNSRRRTRPSPCGRAR